MRFNFHRLKQYVPHNESVDSLCRILNSLGLEVEEVVTPSDDLAGLRVGKILGKAPHPDADRLTVCRVDVGDGDPVQIVCGATNHFEGAGVVVALPGQVLPGGFEIREREVRGVPSAGMMCSQKELGLGDDHEGILILPDEAVPGESPFPYLTNIELSITPNRPDCLGWIGIAREIAIATDRDLRIPASVVESEGEETIPVHLEDPEGCPRYMARILRGVRVGPSPQWLRNALTEVGLSAISNVVDVTNFVLMERGHPLHAFDLSKLAGPEIRVRRAADGEVFEALNGETYTLSSTHLVVADAEKAVALGGIMGGADSEVRETTTDLLIECAYFNPTRIRRGSRLLGLSTDSSYRFERGVDPEGLAGAIDRCVSLILEVAGGRVASPRMDEVSKAHLPSSVPVTLRTEKASEKVGVPIPHTQQKTILERLGCEISEKNEGVFLVKPPTFRPDLEREIDLIEELARHYGYESIPSVPPEMPTVPGGILPTLEVEKRIRDYLIDRGWTETKSFSFTSASFEEHFRLDADHPLRRCVRIRNPIGADMADLRTTLMPNLLETLRRNYYRGEKSLRVFETGKVYLPDLDDILACEREAVGLAWMGHEPTHWSATDRDYDFFDAKGTVESLLRDLGIEGFTIEPFECEYLHPGQCGRWGLDGRTLGVVGRLHPEVTRSYELPSDPILVELDLAAISSQLGRKTTPVRVPSPFPPIRRDLSLTVPVETTARDLLALIESRKTPFLEEVELFDRYTGEQVGPGRQSLGFRLTYRAPDRTLTEEEISTIHLSLLKDLNEKLGATQRGMDPDHE